MDRARERTLRYWEENLPEEIERRARDMRFLLAVDELDKLPPDSENEAFGLLEHAWLLDQACLKVELDMAKFLTDIQAAREFLHGPDFEEYDARFRRYV